VAAQLATTFGQRPRRRESCTAPVSYNHYVHTTITYAPDVGLVRPKRSPIIELAPSLTTLASRCQHWNDSMSAGSSICQEHGARKPGRPSLADLGVARSITGCPGFS